MSSILNPPSSSIIRQWEEANAQLTSVLSNYLTSCQALESLLHLAKPTSPQNLTVDIDRIINFLRTIAFEQLAQSCSSLARTRNRLVTSIYSLPEEVLSEIFHLVIYAPDKVQPLRAGIQTIYHRLHTLVSVCSVWRRVGLAQGTFWSIIPIMDDESRDLDYATQLSLQRCRNSELHIAADLGLSMPKSIAVLAEQAARFRSLNIRSKSDQVVADIISLWLEHGVPGTVTELSICCDHQSKWPGDSTGMIDNLCSRGSHIPPLLAKFMAPLSTLRISHTLLHHESIAFEGLAELRIDNVGFDTHTDYKTFLRYSSSMPVLRSLHIVSVSVRFDWEHHASTDRLSISFPSLQTLYLGDLSPSLLEFTFESLAPGSYQVTLYLKNSDGDSSDSQEGNPLDIDRLAEVLQGRSVSVLLFESSYSAGSMISPLLRALPNLHSLWLGFLVFDKYAIEALTRPASNTLFPALRQLHVSYLILRPESTELFKEMVSSHPIENLTLGGVPDRSQLEADDDDTECISPEDEIVTWLQASVPNFRLIDRRYGLPEFRYHEMWPLW